MANSPTKCPIISGLISMETYSLPECNWRFNPNISGMTIMSLTWDLTRAGLPPFSFLDWRTCSIRIRCSLVRPLRSDLRCREGRSLMNSSIDICLSSSTEWPRYVNCLGAALHPHCVPGYDVHHKNVPGVYRAERRLARPVWRAAMLPTFLPGGVSRPTVVGFPACLCLPPP